MPMKRVGRGSLAFLLTCVDCDGVLTVHTHDGSGFSAARIAGQRRAWTFAKGLERCGGCSKRATGKATRKAPASRKR